MPESEHKTISAIAARFSQAAGSYHRLAAVQRKVAKNLIEIMPGSPVPAHILEIGCGTGVLTVMLAGKLPFAQIDAVDVSSAMTIKARDYLAGKHMINWITADACRLSEHKKYPLIVSSCALHWIAPFEKIIQKLGALLTPGGTLAFAVMARGTLAELNASRHRIAPHKLARVVLPTGKEIKHAVAKAGLRLRTEKTGTIRVTFLSPEKLLRQLHDQGLTGGNTPCAKSLLTRSEIGRLIADYRKKYSTGRGVYATYRVFYGVAQKKIRG